MNHSNDKRDAPAGHDWLLWQLADSAFPTGGFAHSAGLEAAWQHGEVRHRSELQSWLEDSLHQVAHAALPFVNAAHAEPHRFPEFDQLCDAFTTNHVANRASRLQGKALFAAAKRIFPGRVGSEAVSPMEGERVAEGRGRGLSPQYAHLAPLFGKVTCDLGVPHTDALRLFTFTHLRGIMAAAVRLNIVGPIEGQAIQFQLSGEAEEVVQHGQWSGLEDLAQTAPVLDVWQGAQDRLYSRLFQS